MHNEPKYERREAQAALRHERSRRRYGTRGAGVGIFWRPWCAVRNFGAELDGSETSRQEGLETALGQVEPFGKPNSPGFVLAFCRRIGVCVDSLEFGGKPPIVSVSKTDRSAATNHVLVGETHKRAILDHHCAPDGDVPMGVELSRPLATVGSFKNRF